LDPEDPFGYQVLLILNRLLGNHNKALSLAEKAVSLAPNDYLAVGNLAIALLYMDEVARALETFEHAKRLAPIFPKWFQRLYGFALHLADRKDQAIAVLEELARQEPEWSEGLAQLAAAYVSAGRVDAAQATTKKILEQDPGYTASRHPTAQLLSDTGRAAWFRDLLLKAGLPE
jgi:adenylate cyclase